MRIGLVAGESSGDLLGAGLIRAIASRYPDATFEGVAGPAMVAAGCEAWEPAESLAVMGLVEPLAHVPRLLRLRKSLVKRWSESPPDVFVGIDAPDFNLGLEKKLRANGVRTVHYVSPSIWAWRPGRVKTIRKAADRVLCILPFEKAIYDEHGVDAVFVGHPRADAAPDRVDTAAARRELGIESDVVIAVLPGSRMSEVTRLGEILADAASIMADERPGLKFVTPIATQKLRSLVESQIAAAGMEGHFLVLDGQSEQAMRAADVVVLASGTAALESALLGKPTVATYRLAALSHLLLIRSGIVKLTHYTLPNLLTEEPLVPELMQENATPELIATEVLALLDDPVRCESISKRFAKLRGELAQDTDQRAADAVIELANR